MIATVVMTALDSHPVLSDADNNFCYFLTKNKLIKAVDGLKRSFQKF